MPGPWDSAKRALAAFSIGGCLAGPAITGALGDDDGIAAAAEGTSAVDGTDVFYAPRVIQQIRLDIEPSDRAAMFDALPDRVYVPATFHWNDITIDNVAVRFKGNSSSNPDATHKRSYLVKFDEYVDGQRFLGLRRVALDNADSNDHTDTPVHPNGHQAVR